MSLRNTRSGFTLIELMIVVAIIGILAAIAIPTFQMYQHRSRRSEAFTNLAAILRAQESSYAESSTYQSTMSSWPGLATGTTKQNWSAASETEWGPIGWRPEGSTYYDYSSNSSTGCTCVADNCFTAAAYGDLDADGFVAVVILAHPDPNLGDCPELLGGALAENTAMARVHDRPLAAPELSPAFTDNW
jgi:prepilin-type N-terminal cleavage/methylation domain-containing protein